MKNKKIMKKFVKSLTEAEKIARENRDVEALVAISDRWYALFHGDDEDDRHRLALGFISQELHNDSGKAHDQRKG